MPVTSSPGSSSRRITKSSRPACTTQRDPMKRKEVGAGGERERGREQRQNNTKNKIYMVSKEKASDKFRAVPQTLSYHNLKPTFPTTTLALLYEQRS